MELDDHYRNTWGPEDEEESLLTLEDVCSAIGIEPVFSPYGYVIAPDGTVYSLCREWHHGVVLALLRPDLLEQAGYDAPRRHCNVYKYQRFLFFAQHVQVPYVIISFGYAVQYAVSASEESITSAQLSALAACLLLSGATGDTPVQTDFGTYPAADVGTVLLAKSSARGSGC